jgi:predicted outer membrane lipoprotein
MIVLLACVFAIFCIIILEYTSSTYKTNKKSLTVKQPLAEPSGAFSEKVLQEMTAPACCCP